MQVGPVSRELKDTPFTLREPDTELVARPPDAARPSRLGAEGDALPGKMKGTHTFIIFPEADVAEVGDGMPAGVVGKSPAIPTARTRGAFPVSAAEVPEHRSLRPRATGPQVLRPPPATIIFTRELKRRSISAPSGNWFSQMCLHRKYRQFKLPVMALA
ncbi:MAG: hypothetical protein IPJ28_09715 [Betaproteobacteria bacterium]|nr:hypothetical protein [Betaproteobacteria bacterium]